MDDADDISLVEEDELDILLDLLLGKVDRLTLSEEPSFVLFNPLDVPEKPSIPSQPNFHRDWLYRKKVSQIDVFPI